MFRPFLESENSKSLPSGRAAKTLMLPCRKPKLHNLVKLIKLPVVPKALSG